MSTLNFLFIIPIACLPGNSLAAKEGIKFLQSEIYKVNFWGYIFYGYRRTLSPEAYQHSADYQCGPDEEVCGECLTQQQYAKQG